MESIVDIETGSGTAGKATTAGYANFATKGLNGKESLVEDAKIKAGELLDIFQSATNAPGTEGGRMYALAKTNLEQAIMWFVKGVSRSA